MTENIQENENTEQPVSQDLPEEAVEAATEVEDVEEPLEEPEEATEEAVTESEVLQSLQNQEAASSAPEEEGDPDAKRTPGGYQVDDPRFEWFAIQTQSSMEKKAIQGLRQRVAKYNLQEN